MAAFFKSNKRQKEERRKKKQEEKRLKRLNKKEASASALPDSVSLESSSATTGFNPDSSQTV